MLVYQRVTLKYSLHVPVVFHMSRLAETKIGLLWRSHKNVRMCQDMVTFFGSSYGTSNHYIVLMSFYSVFYIYIYIYILYIYIIPAMLVSQAVFVTQPWFQRFSHLAKLAMLWPCCGDETIIFPLEMAIHWSQISIFPESHHFFRYVLTFKISTF